MAVFMRRTIKYARLVDLNNQSVQTFLHADCLSVVTIGAAYTTKYILNRLNEEIRNVEVINVEFKHKLRE